MACKGRNDTAHKAKYCPAKSAVVNSREHGLAVELSKQRINDSFELFKGAAFCGDITVPHDACHL